MDVCVSISQPDPPDPKPPPNPKHPNPPPPSLKILQRVLEWTVPKFKCIHVCYVMLCYVMLCCVMLCCVYATSRCVVLGWVALHIVTPFMCVYAHSTALRWAKLRRYDHSWAYQHSIAQAEPSQHHKVPAQAKLKNTRCLRKNARPNSSKPSFMWTVFRHQHHSSHLPIQKRKHVCCTSDLNYENTEHQRKNHQKTCSSHAHHMLQCRVPDHWVDPCVPGTSAVHPPAWGKISEIFREWLADFTIRTIPQYPQWGMSQTET